MKKWYLSKTLWFNLLSISLVIIQYCNDVHILSIELQALLVAIINILLRYITNQPIKKG